MLSWLMVAALRCVRPQFQWYQLAYATEIKSIQLHDSIVRLSQKIVSFTLHYITSHHITSHHITLHYITIHYITLHYITLHNAILMFRSLFYFVLLRVNCVIFERPRRKRPTCGCLSSWQVDAGQCQWQINLIDADRSMGQFVVSSNNSDNDPIILCIQYTCRNVDEINK